MRQRAMIAMAIAQRPDAAHRRRADHRARRHRAGPDPRGAASELQARARHGDRAHHPRPRRGRRRRRPDRGDVRRPDRGDGAASTSLHAPRHPYTAGLLAGLPALDQARPASSTPIPGQPPNLLDLPPGLRVPPALPLAAQESAGRTVPPLVAGGDGRRRARRRAPARPACTRSEAAGRGTPADADRAAGEAVWRSPRRTGRAGGRATWSSTSRRPGHRLPAAGRRGPGRRRRLLRPAARARRWARRRVRLRQVDRRPAAAAPAGAHRAASVSSTGEEITELVRGAARGRLRRDMQIVFQDPYASLEPADDRAARSSAEPYGIHRVAPRATAGDGPELLELVGLPPSTPTATRTSSPAASASASASPGRSRSTRSSSCSTSRSPRSTCRSRPGHQPAASELQDELGLTYLFIAHDLSVVRHISRPGRRDVPGQDRRDRRRATALTSDPRHPYTQALLSAVPVPDPAASGRASGIVLTGDVPSPADPPSGCRFRTRCWKAPGAPRRPTSCGASARRRRCSRRRGTRDTWLSCHFAEERAHLA